MARIGPVLEQLDDALGTLCSSTPKELHAGWSMFAHMVMLDLLRDQILCTAAIALACKEQIFAFHCLSGIDKPYAVQWVQSLQE